MALSATRDRWTIGDGAAWSFLNGRWADGSAGEILPYAEEHPPGVAYDDQSGAFMAVRHDRCYGDFAAQFRFRFRSGHAGARFVFRLQDATRYYALDIPWCGQQCRNRHAWAGVVIADGTPLQRYLQFQLVLEVVPRNDYWYRARVECVGARIRAWIKGRLVADVEDQTYRDGLLGIMGITPAGSGCVTDFADIEVDGAYRKPSAWCGLKPLAPHWVTPCPETDPETYQSYPGIIRSKSGELMASIPFGNPAGEEPRYIKWVRSCDAGRTWSKPEPATLDKGFGASFVKKDGTWVTLHTRPGATGASAFYTYTSRDDGRSWQGPNPLTVVGEWPPDVAEAGPSGQPLRLRDGTLLVPIMCQREFRSYVNAKVSTNYVLRSTDDGATWAAPVWCDQNNMGGEAVFCVGNFSEIGLAETADNVVIGYGRPGPWPYMWRVQSNDGGKSWEPAAFGSFPGYCSTLTGTASGALVAVHRFPYISANVSRDGGVTWDAGTILDYPLWANHQALEVEPDVVLVNYMGYIGEPGQPDRRVLRLRVTPRGLTVDR